MSLNNEDDEAGKIFVGGIHRSTTQDGLKHYFEKFGEVKVVKLMMDKETGNSRGFGFVTYVDPSCISQVMGSKPHTLDGKIIDPKPCSPKHVLQQKKLGAQFPKTHKIFLGGVSMEATEEDVRQYFSKYGSVVEVNFVVDKTDSSRPHKGFGFVTFEEESSVDQAVAKHYHIIKDKRTEAKRAETKEKTNSAQMMMGMNMTPNMMGLVTGGQQPQQQQGWMNGMQNYGYGNAMMNQFQPNQFQQGFPNQMYAGYGYGMQQQGQMGAQGNVPNNMAPGGMQPNQMQGNMMGGNMGQPQQMGGHPNMPGMPGNMAGNMQQPGQGMMKGPNPNYQQSNSGYGPMRQAGGGNMYGGGGMNGNNHAQMKPMKQDQGGYHPYRR